MNTRERIRLATLRMPFGESLPILAIDGPPTDMLGQLADYLEALQERLELHVEQDAELEQEVAMHRERLRVLAGVLAELENYFGD